MTAKTFDPWCALELMVLSAHSSLIKALSELPSGQLVHQGHEAAQHCAVGGKQISHFNHLVAFVPITLESLQQQQARY